MVKNVGSARIYKLMPVILVRSNSFIIILVNVFKIRSKTIHTRFNYDGPLVMYDYILEKSRAEFN